MSILDARVKLAAVLAPKVGEPPVHVVPVDAVSPPCMYLGWRTPVMIDNRTACQADAHLTVTLVGGRIEVASAIPVIEEMYDRLQRRLRETPGGWAIQTDSGIVERTIGNVAYLTCRVDVRVPITL